MKNFKDPDLDKKFAHSAKTLNVKVLCDKCKTLNTFQVKVTANLGAVYVIDFKIKCAAEKNNKKCGNNIKINQRHVH